MICSEAVFMADCEGKCEYEDLMNECLEATHLLVAALDETSSLLLVEQLWSTPANQLKVLHRGPCSIYTHATSLCHGHGNLSRSSVYKQEKQEDAHYMLLQLTSLLCMSPPPDCAC